MPAMLRKMSDNNNFIWEFVVDVVYICMLILIFAIIHNMQQQIELSNTGCLSLWGN